MMKGVLMQHDFIDRMLELNQRAMQAIGNGQLLEVQPKALNGIEKGTVLGQPENQQTVFIEAESGPNRLAVMIGGIVHHQDQVLAGVGCQQVFEKCGEGVAVFVGSGEIGDVSGVPVVGTKHMQELWAARCRDELTLALPHPTAAQRRV